MSNYANNKGNQ